MGNKVTINKWFEEGEIINGRNTKYATYRGGFRYLIKEEEMFKDLYIKGDVKWGNSPYFIKEGFKHNPLMCSCDKPNIVKSSTALNSKPDNDNSYMYCRNCKKGKF